MTVSYTTTVAVVTLSKRAAGSLIPNWDQSHGTPPRCTHRVLDEEQSIRHIPSGVVIVTDSIGQEWHYAPGAWVSIMTHDRREEVTADED